MFKAIKSCPFCKSKKSKKILNKKLIKNFYVEAIISELNINFKFLEKKLERRECQSCFSIYFSKWFNDFIQKKIFLTIYGQHNMKWQNFYNFKLKRYNNDSECLLEPEHQALLHGPGR